MSAITQEDLLCDACRAHFAAVRSYLDAMSIPYVVNPKIVRGLDYYNRTEFEITSNALGAQSTVCAGGRYDGLVASLGGPDTPGVGFALGMERFLLVAEAAGAHSEPARRGYQAVALGDQARGALFEIAAALRARGEAAFMDYGDRKLKAQFKIADRNRARYALILGSEELAAGELVVRDLETRSERRVSLGKDVIAAIVEARE